MWRADPRDRVAPVRYRDVGLRGGSMTAGRTTPLAISMVSTARMRRDRRTAL